MDRLRTSRPTRFRRGADCPTVEELALRTRVLVRERQELRASGAGAAPLERNRMQIARGQWDLGWALIDRHLPAQPVQAAA
jgi:hypothetical protein